MCTVGVWGRCVQLGYGGGVYVGVYSWDMGRCVCGCVQLGYGVGVCVGVYSWGMGYVGVYSWGIR